MKTVSAGMQTHLGQACATLALCWKITATDGTVRGFTSNTRDLVFNGVTYSSAMGFTPTSTTTTITLAVSSLEVDGVLVSGGFDRDDVLHGKWDKAVVEIFVVNYLDLTLLDVKIRKGWVGDIQLGNHGFTAEIRGLTQALSQQIVDLYQPSCRADLGDTKCQVTIDPPAWSASTAYVARVSGSAEIGDTVKPTTQNHRHFKCTTAGTSGGTEPSWNTTIGGETNDGTVVWTTIQALQVDGTITSKTNNRVFFASGLTEPDNWFDQGKITFNTGLNAGRSMEVKTFLNTGGSIELVLPFVEAVAIGDTFTIHRGCAKRITEDCIGLFDNVVNFRGEPHVPQTAEASLVST